MLKSYKELIVWQKAIDLTVKIYKITSKFPRTELFGLTDQIRRSAVAIASNIAEGNCRGHISEYIQYLQIAFASGAELETQLLISYKVNYLSKETFSEINSLLDEVLRMLNAMLVKLKLNRKREPKT